jgi:hypothetical protein
MILTQSIIVTWRDITQLNSPTGVMFSADTTPAEQWMRKQYGSSSLVFELPSENAKAVAFKEAAEAQNFIIIVLARRMSANM